MAYAGPAFSARATPSIKNYIRTSDQLGDIRMRLETGKRVVRIGDDSASITAAASLQAQGSTLRSALVNGAKTTSFLQIAYNGLDQIKAVLETLSNLTATANEAGRTGRQRATLDTQFQSGLTQIDSIVATTTYGGSSILDGSISGTGAAVIPTGNLSGDAVTVDIPDVSSGSLFPATPSLATAGTASTATTQVSDAEEALADAIGKVEAYQLQLLTAGSAVDSTLGGLNLSLEDLLGINRDEVGRTNEALLLRQDTTATLAAQTLRFNSGLLDLLTLPTLQ